MKPTTQKPSIILAQVEGSGTAEVKAAWNVSALALSNVINPSLVENVCVWKLGSPPVISYGVN
jgi:hypothetical protein